MKGVSSSMDENVASTGIDERLFLQYIVASKTVSQNALCDFWVACFKQSAGDGGTSQLSYMDNDDVVDSVEHSISKINMLLLPMHLEVKKHKATSDEGPQIYYSFINLVEDAPSKLCTDYSAEDVKVITALIKKCMENSEGTGERSIGSADALNEYKKHTGRSFAMGQNLFQSLIQGGWLNLNKRGEYVLGPRLMAELQSQLESNSTLE